MPSPANPSTVPLPLLPGKTINFFDLGADFGLLVPVRGGGGGTDGWGGQKDKDAVSCFHPFHCPWGPLPKLPTMKTSLPLKSSGTKHVRCRAL